MDLNKSAAAFTAMFPDVRPQAVRRVVAAIREEQLVHA